MSKYSQALHPHLYPAPDRTYWGVCSRCGQKLYMTAEWWSEHKKQTAREVVTDQENLTPRKVVPVLLPCGDVYNFVKQLYKQSDGVMFYA
jgi:hypothetical protein